MFEVKKTKDETLFIGNWVDILHFGEVFSKIYKEQREMISYGSFCGTLDEYALHLGYSSPASSLFRKRLEELEKIGIAEIVPYSEEFFKEHKNEFRTQKARGAPFKQIENISFRYSRRKISAAASRPLRPDRHRPEALRQSRSYDRILCRSAKRRQSAFIFRQAMSPKTGIRGQDRGMSSSRYRNRSS